MGYKVEVDQAKKKLIVKAEGFFKVPDAEGLIREFEQAVKTINPAQFDLVIDSKDQAASGPDVIPLQERAMGLYMNTPFRSRHAVVMKSAITTRQIKRLGQNPLEESFAFHETFEDAMKG